MSWTLGYGLSMHHSPGHVEHPTVEGCVFTVICRDRRRQTIFSQKAFTAMTAPYPTRFAMSLDAVEVIYICGSNLRKQTHPRLMKRLDQLDPVRES